MLRWFNTAGPCNPADHYMLPAARRVSSEVRPLIEQKSYFVLHAPRQVGKTTALLSLAQELTAEGRYVAALVSMEVGAPFPMNVGTAEAAILDDWRASLAGDLPPELQPPRFPSAAAGSRIRLALQAWAEAAPRPLVLFLDEIDALRDRTLISILRQLRSGYRNRPGRFPALLALVGLRDVRDYKVDPGSQGRLGTASPFNVKVESLILRNFTRDEVAELYAQHTADTGQRFTPDAIDRAFYWTQGQPWLVNALARQMVQRLVPDRTQPLTAAHVDAAKQILVDRQDTHLDSLGDRLRESRIRAIIEPMLAGRSFSDVSRDDIRFAQDLGLVRMAELGGLEVANPLYREIIPRVLADTAYASLPRIHATWLTPEGRLNPERLLDAFLAFWRQHGQPLLATAPYHEVAPHIVLTAFLHRVANGGGTLEREYAVGTGRMDVCLRYGPDTLAMELKLRRGRADLLAEGLAQLDTYMAGLGLDGGTGWLIIFDQRKNQPPISERTTSTPATTPAGRHVTVIRG